MAADERGSTPMKTRSLSAFIGVHRRPIGLFLLCVAIAHAATRPQYGGTLRVEVRQNPETPDPPPLLGPGFTIARWEAGRLAVYEADENAAGGRPFLDRVEILMGRSLRDQASDLDLGKADVVELGPNELRRQPAGRRVWTSSPVRVLALGVRPALRRCARPRSPRAGRGSLRHPQRAAPAAGRNLRRTAPAVALRLRLPLSRGGRPRARPPTRRRRTAHHAGRERPRRAPHRGTHRPQRPRRRPRRLRDLSTRQRRRLAGGVAHRVDGPGESPGRTRRGARLAGAGHRANRPNKSTPPSAPCSRAFA